MAPAMRKSLIVGKVRSWLHRLLVCGLLVVSVAGWTADEHAIPDLTVHEWGTFTAIAGKDGRAAEWLPLGFPRYPASTDLPQFVEHINGVNFKRDAFYYGDHYSHKYGTYYAAPMSKGTTSIKDAAVD